MPAELAAIYQVIAAAAKAKPIYNTGSVAYLRFEKTGQWTAGRERASISPSEEFTVSIGDFGHGWVNWAEDNKSSPHFETRASIGEALPRESELPPPAPGTSYTPQLGVTFLSNSTGVAHEYWTNSKGGVGVLEGLLRAIHKHAPAAALEGPYPVVTFSASSYRHKKFGLIQTPTINVVGWTYRLPD